MKFYQDLCADIARDGLGALTAHVAPAHRAAFGRMVTGLGDDFRPEFRVEPDGVRALAGGAAEVTVCRHHPGEPVYVVCTPAGWFVNPFGLAAACAAGHALVGVPDGLTDVPALARALSAVPVARSAQVAVNAARVPFAAYAGFGVAPVRLHRVWVAAAAASAHSPRAGTVHLAGAEKPVRCLFTSTRRLERINGHSVGTVARAWLSA